MAIIILLIPDVCWNAAFLPCQIQFNELNSTEIRRLNRLPHFCARSTSVVALHTLRIEKICFSPKVSIQLCWLKSDSALPRAISAQSGPKKLHQKAIPA